MNLAEYIHSGGPIMYAIVFFALVASFILFDKWFQFHRDQINAGELINGLTNVLKRDGYTEAMTLCDAYPGPVSRLLSAAIQSYKRGDTDDEIRQAIENTAMSEMPRLEKYVNLLATIAYITPLLGLLGTVLGMMYAFDVISAQGEALVAKDLSSAIGLALITTAGGLTVAIPAYIAYNYLVSRIETLTFDMEKAASEILSFFHEQRKNTDEAS